MGNRRRRRRRERRRRRRRIYSRWMCNNVNREIVARVLVEHRYPHLTSWLHLQPVIVFIFHVIIFSLSLSLSLSLFLCLCLCLSFSFALTQFVSDHQLVWLIDFFFQRFVQIAITVSGRKWLALQMKCVDRFELKSNLKIMRKIQINVDGNLIFAYFSCDKSH